MSQMNRVKLNNNPLIRNIGNKAIDAVEAGWVALRIHRRVELSRPLRGAASENESARNGCGTSGIVGRGR